MRAYVLRTQGGKKSARSGLCVTPRTWPEMGLVVANPRRALQPGCFSESPIFLPEVPASHPAWVPGFPTPAIRPQCQKDDAGGGLVAGWPAGMLRSDLLVRFGGVRAEKQDSCRGAGSTTTC